MRKLRLLLGLPMAIVIVAFPSGAAAEPVVPPGNSAATQYTEAFPTAGGEREIGGHHNGKRTPVKVLGGRNTQRLEAKGPQGRAVATFAAETSPTLVATSDRGGTGNAAGTGGGGAKHEARTDRESRSAGGERGGANPGGTGVRGVEPSGSSGLGEVIGQATGSSSSGQMGLLLPLVVIGAVLWSLVFLWRQRRRVA